MHKNFIIIVIIIILLLLLNHDSNQSNFHNCNKCNALLKMLNINQYETHKNMLFNLKMALCMAANVEDITEKTKQQQQHGTYMYIRHVQ